MKNITFFECKISLLALLFFTTTLSFAQYCTSSTSTDVYGYIGNFQLNTINKSSGTSTYSDFTGTSTSLNTATNYSLSITPNWPSGVQNSGYAVWIDYNQDKDFDDPGEQVWIQSVTTANPTGSFTVPATATSGNTRMRVSMNLGTIPTSPCDTSNFGEVEDYTVNIVAASNPEINVKGNNINISDNDTTPRTADFTNFGTVLIGANFSRTFTIQNTGSDNLNLTGTPKIVISGTDAGSFSVTTAPLSPIAPSGSTTFVIKFNPTSSGVKNATLSIANNDNDENPYNFSLLGTGSTVTTSEVKVSVYWPAFSTENTVEIYNPNNMLIATITGTSDDDIYATELNLGCLADNLNTPSGTGYYVIVYDDYGDGWDSGGTLDITSGGINVLSYNGGNPNLSNGVLSETIYFNVTNGGCGGTPEINIQGNAIDIIDGDTTPRTADFTNFGSIGVGNNFSRTFTIQNLGTSNLNLTGASPRILISGTNAASFSITTIPTTPIVASGSTTFVVRFTPTTTGIKNATLTIANNDSDEDPYNFSIRGTGTDVGVCLTTINTFPYAENFENGIGSWIQDTGDNFNWTRRTGTTPSTSTGPYGAASGAYYMYTEANTNNSKTANLISPCFDLTGTVNPRFTFSHHSYGDNISLLSVQISTDNGITFPTTLFTTTGQVQLNTNAAWIPISIDLKIYIGQTVKLRIRGITGAGNNSDMAIDNIRMTNKPNPIYAPGGVTNDLSMWLKGNDGLGYADGQAVALWQDQGIASDAKVHVAGQEPIFRDNATKNVNFNPVVEFDNIFTSYSFDNTYSYDDTSRKFLEGNYGLYTEEMFIVLIPDDTSVNNSFGFMDVFSGDANSEVNQLDETGIGFGNFTGRIANEIIGFAYDKYDTGIPGDGYAVAEIGTGSNYTNIGIINARNNSANTQQELFYNANNIGNTQNDVAEYMNASDSRFWLGRSEGRNASLNARVAEVISYKVRKTDANLSQERNRIQSYLGIKYGITLGVNGTSQDYVNSSGSVIWNQAANADYNYNIAGMGRDDLSELNQKQSKSVNDASDITGPTEGILTIGLSDIYDTNNLNTNAFPVDKQFLVWGDNGADLNLASSSVTVNISAGVASALTTDVSFTAMQRIWKVIETGGDIPSCKVRIPQNAIRNMTPSGSYLMFISDSNAFNTTADYRVMTPDGNGNLETDYNFDGTKFITFGFAPQVIAESSVSFDGVQDYIDVDDHLDLNTTAFTLSAWIKRDNGTTNASILSKRNAANSEGYDLRINALGKLEFNLNGGAPEITSSVAIPANEWHQVAVIYNSGNATLYIDGVADTSASSLPAPVATSQKFLIAAADGSAPNTTDYFAGTIDEVRIWNVALTVNQLRYIMNQEIIDDVTFALKYGSVIPSSITKNEISSIPWSDLAGYYPMSIYAYTSTNDMSGNGNQGTLRNINTVDRQTAPLPYKSQAPGSWDAAATWLNNTVQTLPNSLSIIDGTTPIDWNIVEINNDIYLGATTTAVRLRNCSVEGLIINSGDLQVNGDTASNTGIGLTVTHYLKLDGTIDLEGESQLVQTDHSDLDPASPGTLERDQQGNSNTYLYNYWCSPVGVSNSTTNNNSYIVPNVITNVGFLTSGLNGTTSPLKISDYWIWKFANLAFDDYGAWQHIRSTGSLLTGEGFTMKGPGTATPEQNYIMQGKPNNGDFSLPLSVGNEYLTGNPYPSAMDADEFIKDNIGNTETNGRNPAGNVINGALYFWDHFANNTHILLEYEGGYATYTLMGGVVAISNDTRINASGQNGTKIPERYIPVGQGFFVNAVLDPNLSDDGISNPVVGGNILFKNSQRVFVKEAPGSSIFMKSANTKNKNGSSSTSKVDTRQKIKLYFDSPKGYHRQLLVGADANATNNFDIGYDAPLIEDNNEDIYWVFNNANFIIQAVNNFDAEQTLPLGIKISKAGLATIKIDALENMGNNQEIYLHDKELNIYHNLKESDYHVYLTVGKYIDRFEITFLSNTLGLDDRESLTLQVYYSNENNSIILNNPDLKDIKSVELFNILGQSTYRFDSVETKKYLEFKTKSLNEGIYIVNIKTADGQTLSEKVFVVK